MSLGIPPLLRRASYNLHELAVKIRAVAETRGLGNDIGGHILILK